MASRRFMQNDNWLIIGARTFDSCESFHLTAFNKNVEKYQPDNIRMSLNAQSAAIRMCLSRYIVGMFSSCSRTEEHLPVVISKVFPYFLREFCDRFRFNLLFSRFFLSIFIWHDMIESSRNYASNLNMFIISRLKTTIQSATVLGLRMFSISFCCCVISNSSK